MKDNVRYYLTLIGFLAVMAVILLLFHEYLEKYSGALMVLITFIYVVATVEICRANIKSAEATREQLVESKRQFDETKRLEHMPYLQASFGEWKTGDEHSSCLPDMWLNINHHSNENDVSSGMSMDITNIGLGLAVNLKCKWVSGEMTADKHLSATLLRQADRCTSTFIISTDKPCEKTQFAKAALVICFDDFLGNHYEQTIEVSFEIHQDYLTLVHYRTEMPVYLK